MAQASDVDQCADLLTRGSLGQGGEQGGSAAGGGTVDLGDCATREVKMGETGGKWILGGGVAEAQDIGESVLQNGLEGVLDAAASGQNAFDYLAMHVRQTALDAVVIIRQPLMIQAEQVKNGRVEIVNRHRVLAGLISHFIG